MAQLAVSQDRVTAFAQSNLVYLFRENLWIRDTPLDLRVSEIQDYVVSVLFKAEQERL
jgi:hypothetical protein